MIFFLVEHEASEQSLHLSDCRVRYSSDWALVKALKFNG